MEYTVKNQVFDEERALYAAKDTAVIGCAFEGAADGESALKEARRICVTDTRFALRYPLWHAEETVLCGVTMTDTCRAPLWYARDIVIKDSRLHGTKAVRECKGVSVENTEIVSEEFGWFSEDVALSGGSLSGMYAFLHTAGVKIDGLYFEGKYSFQYVKDAVITRSILKTKDAFWHAKNITVVDSVVEGEYLGWYSEGLRLVRCHIKGTQPLCYAKDLVLEDCTMEDCDLAFEKSTVTATVSGRIDSVKAPLGGSIVADEIGEILTEDDGEAGAAQITVRA